MKICIVIGSRADEGLLLWPIKMLQEDGEFDVTVLDLHDASAWETMRMTEDGWPRTRPDWVLLLGDRFEILASALGAHLQRIKIAHLCGGDQTEGSYDDAMRDCISRLATLHFVTNEQALARLLAVGYSQVHLVGSPGIDYIRHGDWLKARPIQEPYVVVSYQPETIDGTNDLPALLDSLSEKLPVFLMPNPDRGSEEIRQQIMAFSENCRCLVYEAIPHDEFLNLLAHCDEFIGNSSAIFYEAPELGVPTRLVGKRQRGRVRPWGDGHASERIVAILKSFDREQVSV